MLPSGMIGLIISAATAATPLAACYVANKDDVVVERLQLQLPHGHKLQAVSVSHHGDGPLGFDASQVFIYTSSCQIAYAQRFDGAMETRFDDVRLGDQPILVLTSYQLGGSGCGYSHTILSYGDHRWRDDAIEPLGPMRLDHDNMDGFYVGDLHDGHGPGLIMWEATDGVGAHYDPYHYKITTYRWSAGRFSGPTIRDTAKAYSPDPDMVAKQVGLRVRDMTRQHRFTGGGC